MACMIYALNQIIRGNLGLTWTDELPQTCMQSFLCKLQLLYCPVLVHAVSCLCYCRLKPTTHISLLSSDFSCSVNFNLQTVQPRADNSGELGSRQHRCMKLCLSCSKHEHAMLMLVLMLLFLLGL